MELQTIDKRIKVIQPIFDDVDERPLDCDFMLPEYLPDIASVLKCIVEPIVQSYQVSGDRVMADGTVLMRLLYLDEERRCVRVFENSQSFTATFTVKEMEGNYRVQLSPKVNYVNCRATGPRRVSIHGAFCVRLKVTGEREETVAQAVDCKDVCTKTRQISYSSPASFAEKVFTVNEVLELEQKHHAESLVRTQATPRITDCRKMEGKAVVKGEISLKTVYVADNTTGRLETSENVILFSQIIDADGLNEIQPSSCKVSMLTYEVHSVQNPNGENNLLSFLAKLSVTLQSYDSGNCTVITDAYHTAYPIRCRTRSIAPLYISENRCESTVIPASVDLPDTGVCKIEDLWCDVLSVDHRKEGGHNYTDVQVLVCMLTRDNKDCLSYYERPTEFAIDQGDGHGVWNCEVALYRCGYTLAEGCVELQLHVHCCGMVVVSEQYAVIGDMTADEKSPYVAGEEMNGCCMKAYFASKGESLWEIAQAQHLPLDLLYRENERCADVLTEDTVLLLTLK